MVKLLIVNSKSKAINPRSINQLPRCPTLLDCRHFSEALLEFFPYAEGNSDAKQSHTGFLNIQYTRYHIPCTPVLRSY